MVFLRPARPPIDANDVLVWRFGKTDTTDVDNEGSGGVCPMIWRNASNPSSCLGPYGRAWLMSTSGYFYSTARPAPVALPTNFTAWQLCKNLRTNGDTAWQHGLSKKYLADATWSSPYNSMKLATYGYPPLNMYLNAGKALSTGALLENNTANTQYPIQTGRWCVLAMTWDDANKYIKGYVNGKLTYSATGAAVGGSGTNGEWKVSCRHTSDGAEFWIGAIAEARVCDVVRSENYIRTITRMMLTDLGLGTFSY